jgi:hypothetical protein
MASQWKRVSAEFAVVVIGVVVGLAADGWRRDFDERRDEVSILQRLQADLIQDSVQLTFGRERLLEKLQPLGRLAGLENVSETSAAEIAADIAAASSYAWNVPSPNSTTFDELVSTGRLNVIRDASLRDGISRYYDAYADQISTIDARRTRFGPVSYELVRRADFAGGRPADFEAAELSAREATRLTAPDLVEEIRVVSTAEISATGWSYNTLALLENLRAELLARLRTYAH